MMDIPHLGMVVREEFLELLRTDPVFREDVRRQILIENLLALPGRFDQLTELVGQSISLLRETVEVVRHLAEDPQRTVEGGAARLVQISIQLNGQDVARAARRVATLRQGGAQAFTVVIGEDWATLDSRDRALARQVEWKVGADLSEGLLAFRRTPSA